MAKPRGRKSAVQRESETPQSHASNASATPPATKRKRISKSTVDWNAVEQRKDFKNGFRITSLKPSDVVLPRSKKRRLNENGDDAANDFEEEENKEQLSPFEDGTLETVYYRVEPSELWLGAQRYRKFTIQEENFGVNDYVYIKAAAADDPDPDAAITGWVGKVLEVRAGNEAHVYLRIYWMYRPEDLPGGREPYHGRNELIASNDMAVVDAQTVEGKANVRHWVEDNDKDEVLNPTQLVWRQMYDVTKSGKSRLSRLEHHCIDKKPCNPDELLIRCDHCKRWLHGSCLEAAAVRKAYQEHQITYPGEPASQNAANSSKRRSSGKADDSGPRKPGRPRKSDVRKSMSAEDVAKDLVFGASVVVDPTVKITVTDRRPGQQSESWDVPVTCLLCGKLVDETKDEHSEDEKKVTASGGMFAIEQNGNGVDEMQTSDEPEPEPKTEFKTEDADSVIPGDEENTGPVTPPNKEEDEESEAENTAMSSSRIASPSRILDSAQATLSAGAHAISDFFQKKVA